MPLTDNKITAFLKKVVDLTDVPSENMSPADLKAWFDSSPEELRVKLNALIDGLTSTTTDSGAKNIGAETISGLTGNDVQTLLNALKTITDNKTDNTGNHAGTWGGLTVPEIGAGDLNGSRIDSITAQLAEKVKYQEALTETNNIKYISHRGVTTIAPENTMPAFELAGELGYWGLETDLAITSDGQWIIMHDETVDRMTNGTGNVLDKTLAQIQALTVDAGSNVASYPNLKVPLLIDFLNVCKKWNMIPILEIKFYRTFADFPLLLQIVKDNGFEKNSFIAVAFDKKDVAAEIHRLNPNISIVQETYALDQRYVTDVKAVNSTLALSFVDNLDAPSVKWHHVEGIKMASYTTEATDTYANLKKSSDAGVDYIYTDGLLPNDTPIINYSNTNNLCLTNLTDYQKHQPFVTGLTYQAAEPLVDNTYTVDSKGIAHVKSAAGSYGAFGLRNYALKVGDVIEVSFKVRNVLGNVGVAFNEVLNGGETTVIIDTYRTGKVGEWETVKIRHLVRNKTYTDLRSDIGLFTADVGEFYLKDVIVRLYSKSAVRTNHLKTYYIRKNPTTSTWEVRIDFSNSGGTLTELDTKTLLLTYSETFNTKLSPIVFAGGEFVASSYKYRPVTSYSNKNSVQIQFLDVANNAVLLSALETNVHATIMAISQS